MVLVAIALPGFAAAADIVAITKAEYDAAKQQLRVEATSTDANASLTIFVTSTDELIGTLTNSGGGKFKGQFGWPASPGRITVRSNSGGSAGFEFPSPPPPATADFLVSVSSPFFFPTPNFVVRGGFTCPDYYNCLGGLGFDQRPRAGSHAR